MAVAGGNLIVTCDVILCLFSQKLGQKRQATSYKSENIAKMFIFKFSPEGKRWLENFLSYILSPQRGGVLNLDLGMPYNVIFFYLIRMLNKKP